MGHQFHIRATHINMLRFIVAFVALVALVAADGPPAPYAPPPTYKEEPKPYSYAYAVKDDYSGANFGASETADGKVVTGSYTVALPDGRIQTVTYTADHYNGYVADVKYEGEAVYPKYEPKPYKPAPAYKPAPKPAYAPAA